jgi:phage gpG-like protein
MNTPIIRIEIPEATRVEMERLKTAFGTEAMLEAIRQGIDAGAAQTVSNIQDTRFTGEGPFPVEEHRLGIRANRLRQSLRNSPAVVIMSGNGGSVEASIGSNVEYAAIHEFGGVIKRTVKAGSVRLRTDRKGNLLRQKDNLAIFAKTKGDKAHKQFREVSFAGGNTYEIRIPARAPLGHGIADNETTFTRAIARAIRRNLKEGPLS